MGHDHAICLADRGGNRFPVEGLNVRRSIISTSIWCCLTSITAGAWTTCGITKDDGSDKSGTAYCWGDNTFGQLGTSEPTENCGSVSCTTSPKPVSSPLFSTPLKFSKIATERTGSCGLTESGDIYCWGDNGNGQLGQGDLLGHPKGTRRRKRALLSSPIAGEVQRILVKAS